MLPEPSDPPCRFREARAIVAKAARQDSTITSRLQTGRASGELVQRGFEKPATCLEEVGDVPGIESVHASEHSPASFRDAFGARIVRRLYPALPALTRR
jgi:hypothetical protein